MKILIIHAYFLDENDFGGSRMNELVKVLKNRGHDITVISSGINYSTGKSYSYVKKMFNNRKIYDSVDLIRVKISDSYNKSFLGRLKAYTEFTYKTTGKILSFKKQDVVITTSPPLFVGTPGLYAKRFKKSKWIFEVRDLWPEFAETTGVIKNKKILKYSYNYERKMYYKSDGVVVLTPAFKRDIISRYPKLENKIKVFTNAADFDSVYFDKEARERIRKKYNLKNKKVFIYTGAHGLANGLWQIIEVAKRIQDKKVVFMLVGDGMKKQELIDEAKRYDLKNILFIPPVSKKDIKDYISAADYGISVLIPNKSFEKIYPNKVFDYMSCERPILNIIKGQTAELIKKSKCGVTAEPGDIEDIINKIYDLLEKDEKENLGENGYNYVKKNFDRKIIMNNYVDYIESI
ncbi:Glycosyltransferase involved in cell wall bisynthesis [Marinitoga hydrogenitolerans DSM 16785]|uniref:Glycosyltransferase involved in cell wall bisynthesis n=1 Tax=Marinitoga hydrogenitolerans (strain DSM 16785 / JCM 12826 / AT1271) TaxID=1122195 RepID=A0A1M4YXI6_MARH1|nr:glycosyltransferase family 4 protein [Marinitoga hydrogenitolerans]SHF10425.1 Glycosyltransferase involved in cell wall bisynthesis [Marinitoga hydrogenitolerans DSM 16785]